MSEHRINSHPLLEENPTAKKVRFTFKKLEYEGIEGEPVAVALLANNVKVLRYTRNGNARGAYCFTGHCFECRLTINGQKEQRSCLVPLLAGMEITQGDS